MAKPKPTSGPRPPVIKKALRPPPAPVAVKERAKAWLAARGKPSRPGPKPS